MSKQASAHIFVTSPDGHRHTDYALADERVTVGRPVPGHVPAIPLGPDPQSWVSRLHCWFERVDGSWFIVDNGSLNGTVVDRDGSRAPLEGQRLLVDDDVILILGYILDDTPFWWRLRFHDPFATHRPRTARPRPNRAHLDYRLTDRKLFVIDGGERHEIAKLGTNLHKLIPHMVNRNAANGGVPVACTHEELIAAVWGDPSTWKYQTAYTRTNLTDLVYQLRRKLRPHEDLVEAVPGIGYTLRTQETAGTSAPIETGRPARD